jgi:CheY-like chemotaxis protein
MLRLLGVHTSPAYGPRAALLQMKEFIPDIIFLDIHMPGVDGFEILTYIRRDPRLASTPVVVITSDDQPETASKARKTGALLTLVKPVSMEALEQVLKKVEMY